MSFGGAKVLVAGTPPLAAGQPVGLKVVRAEGGEQITLWGELARAEQVSGHPEILALGIKFLGDPPVAYKMMLSSFLSGGRRAAPTTPSAARPATPRRPAP